MSFLILQGDARAIPLKDESVDCVVTSPPYWSLRDYGTGAWAGGAGDCAHDRVAARGGRGGSGTPGKQTPDSFPSSFPASSCSKCGATRVDKQIGLEPTIDAYVAELVAVFREVWRVLKPHGTCWLNLGDSYAGSWGNYSGGQRGNGSQRPITNGSQIPNPAYEGHETWRPATSMPQAGLKPKDLCGVPWRVALALQTSGWYLRQAITWCKAAPMPESVQDRFCSATEQIFLLAKQERYYFDVVAAQEPSVVGHRGSSFTSAYDVATKPGLGGNARHDTGTRLMRNYWVINPEPTNLLHFATMPTEIVKRCIQAGSSEKGVCANCSKPWVRQVEKEKVTPSLPGGKYGATDPQSNGHRMAANLSARRQAGGHHDNPFPAALTTGWSPSCSCNAGISPAVVLDPFSGAGTTALCADRLGRHGIGMDLSAAYCKMAYTRVTTDAPLFAATVPVAPLPRQAALFEEENV
jgi:site-specific DNA-methyltransferase (cytosine-N4-specific)